MKTRLRSRALAASLVVLTLSLALQRAASAQKVSADQEGHLDYVNAAGKHTHLTRTGKDSDPCLSPDKHRVAYVHPVPGKPISGGAGNAALTELRLIDVDGTHDTLLVRSAANANPEENLADFASPTFSLDGQTIYFSSAAYAVSGAIHAYDLTTKKVRFVMAGNSPLVVPAGEYKGYLLVEQHRYFIGGGSFDWYWLFRSDGREVGPVGETTDSFRETYFGEK